MSIIQTESFLIGPTRRPRVFAVFSYRYDAHLVPGLLANLRPAVDGFVSCDDRDGPPGLSDEPARRTALLRAARDAGADWILAADPDERFEDGLARKIGDFVRQGRHILWTFALREMLSASTYRTDGLWGGKTQMRLFSLDVAGSGVNRALHGPWVAPRPGLVTRATGLNLYHFRPATAERRRHRRDLYAAADPERRCQAIGYDYLADERGLRAETIEPNKGYSPVFVEDDELWAPPIHLVGTPVEDPVPARLRLISQLLRSRGGETACHIARDLVAARPDDPDLAFMAGLLAADFGCAEGSKIPQSSMGESVASRYLAARQAAAKGDIVHARHLMDGVRRASPSGLWIAHANTATFGPPDFSAPDAAWRDHLSGPAQLFEGPQNGSGRMAVIVLSYRAPAQLRRAVASVLGQDRPAEVVVVNSGGGDPAGVLGDLMPRLRLVDVEERLYVGAARNVGIDASAAPYVAFLAADCVAMPGWIAGREQRHYSGALSVSTPVATLQPDNAICLASNLYNYGRRNPAANAAHISHFGRSYARPLFDCVGYFPPRLRESEDEVFNMAVDQVQMPVWAPDVLTGHDDPQTWGKAITDRMRRGYRMALGPNESAGGRADRPFRLLQARQKARVNIADDLLGRSAGLSTFDQVRLRRLVRGMAAIEALTYRIGKLRVRLARILARIEQGLSAGRLQMWLARQASDLCPQSWRYRLRLGKLWAAAGKPEKALACFHLASGLAHFAAEPALASVSLLSASGHTKRAQEVIERAILLAPRLSPLRLAAARIALTLGDGQLANLHAQIAMAIAPADPETHDLLAEIHTSMGLIDLAAMRRAMALELRRFDAALAQASTSFA